MYLTLLFQEHTGIPFAIRLLENPPTNRDTISALLGEGFKNLKKKELLSLKSLPEEKQGKVTELKEKKPREKEEQDKVTGLKEKRPREKEEDRESELKVRKVREKDPPGSNTKRRSPSQSSSESSVISLMISRESSFEEDEIPPTPSYSPPTEKKELKKRVKISKSHTRSVREISPPRKVSRQRSPLNLPSHSSWSTGQRECRYGTMCRRHRNGECGYHHRTHY